jgi:hypothetical protein
MAMKFPVLCVAAVLSAVAAPVQAHHSFAMFDAHKSLTAVVP